MATSGERLAATIKLPPRMMLSQGQAVTLPLGGVAAAGGVPRYDGRAL